MPRSFERRLKDIPDVDVPDWQLLERIEALYDEYAGETGEKRFIATDSRGQFIDESLESFKAEVEAQDEIPFSIMAVLDEREDNLHFQVWFGQDKYDRGAVFSGTNEASVVHVAERMNDLIHRANARRSERLDAVKKTAAPVAGMIPVFLRNEPGVPDERQWLYNPWVVGVGVILIASALIAIFVAITH
jgi:hypothetical protein